MYFYLSHRFPILVSVFVECKSFSNIATSPDLKKVEIKYVYQKNELSSKPSLHKHILCNGRLRLHVELLLHCSKFYNAGLRLLQIVC